MSAGTYVSESQPVIGDMMWIVDFVYGPAAGSGESFGKH